MPRYQNLKDSMNPYNNNKPILSSSERLQNKKCKTIYQTQKRNYQVSKSCGNKNVKYYSNGTIRNTNSYKMNREITRGAVLCDDCNGNGMVCENLFTKNDLAKINMGNNAISTLTLGTGLSFDIGSVWYTQTNSTKVIVSDVSGSWADPSGRGGCYPGPAPPACYFPYGYADNLMTVPRNLDGSGITIDPDNVLFNQDDNCNTRSIRKPNFLKFASIEVTLVYEGMLGDVPYGYTPTYSNGRPDIPCNDISLNEYTWNTNPSSSRYYKNLINSFVVFSFNRFDSPILNTGQIRKICPLGKRRLSLSCASVDIFKMYITFDYYPKSKEIWQGNITASPNYNVTAPIFKPPYISNFQIKRVKSEYIAATSGDVEFTIVDSVWAGNPGPGISTFFYAPMKVTIIQDDFGRCNIPQLRKNHTKQNYLSCLENGIKNIKFSKN